MKCFIYWTADLKSSKPWSSQLWTQSKQLRTEACKSQDFNGVWTRDLAIPVRRSKQLSYEATDVGSWSIVSSNEPVKNGCEVIYEMFHILIMAYLISNPQFNIWNISYITSHPFGYFIWWVPHFLCGMKLVSNKMPSNTFCWSHHLDFIYIYIYKHFFYFNYYFVYSIVLNQSFMNTCIARTDIVVYYYSICFGCRWKNNRASRAARCLVQFLT